MTKLRTPSEVCSVWRASRSATPSARITCQSAPPGSTRPESRSPLKRPPVMPMMRRRPSGVSPSSCGAARTISALNSGWRFKVFEEPEQLAVGVRRLAEARFLARVADQRAQRLQVGAGMLRGEGGERLVVADQALAPGLEAAVPRAGLRRAAFELGHARADRRGIDVSHQAADVLQLAALRFVALDALGFEDRREQARIERHRVQLPLGQLDQRRAEHLQLVHFALAARLADNFGIHAIIIAPPCPSATDSPATRASCTSLRRPSSSARGAPARAAATAMSPRATA